MSGNLHRTTNLFVRSISLTYFFAFSSIYYQIPGLYGAKGILPAHTLFSDIEDTHVCIKENKALLCLAPKLGLTIELMMDLITLTGIFLSIISFLRKSMQNPLVFFIIWLCYFTLHQVGQTFMWFQWDSLLLEIGFLTIFVAPFSFSSTQNHPKNIIGIWLIKWALFRLMFASGVVKLQSRCPQWWSLTALDVHYESQCIPTALAWFTHHFPQWFQKLCVVGTYVIEVAVPFLFFSPIRAHRLVSFYAQVLLQIAIILTGNYNFFNILTIVMCISLLDDQYLGYTPRTKSPNEWTSTQGILIKILLKWATFAFIVYSTLAYFSIKLTPQSTIDSAIEFTQSEFETWMKKIVPLTVIIGAISLLVTIAEALTASLFEYRSTLTKSWKFITTLVFSLAAVSLFGISLIPYTSLDLDTRAKIWPVFRQMHSATGDYQITSSYGLFRRMTGVGGRPEVIIEGSKSLSGPWIEYDFKYKPVSLSRRPSFIAPHQPRLDWQMWFAALGSYKQNPWLLSLCYRLLEGEKTVLDLLHPETPWKNDPPNYIRAQKYTYHFTARIDKTGNWWRRNLDGEYMPTYEINHPPFVDYLRKQRFIGVQESQYKDNLLTFILRLFRKYTSTSYPETAIWGTTLLTFITSIFINAF